MSEREQKDPAKIPPGWEYNPSAWSERLPIIILGFIGFLIAGYMSLFQYQLINSVWDPFFGNQTEQVLNSELSRVLPIPDAALGALAYLVDVVTGAIGGVKRWRTMPWIVVLFGIAVGPLGFVSVALVISQPVVVGAWCTLCLTTAVISLAMIGPAMDEMLASLQHLKREHQRGRSAWRVFWGLQPRTS